MRGQGRHANDTRARSRDFYLYAVLYIYAVVSLVVQVVAQVRASKRRLTSDAEKGSGDMASVIPHAAVDARRQPRGKNGLTGRPKQWRNEP